MKLLIKSILFSIIVFNICLKPQVKNPEMGDGFWTQVSTMGINQIIWMNDTLYAARNPLYQRNGGVYRSIDGGINWDTLYSVSDVLSSGLRLFIHPTNHRILYLIYGALYKSTNAGQTWNLLFNTFLGPWVRLGINPNNPNIMYVTKSIPYGTVYKTTDGGNIWNDVSNGLPSEEYFQAGPIEVNPEFPDTILLGTNMGLYRSTNAGLNWDSTIVKGFITGINVHPYLSKISFASTLDGFTTYLTEDYGYNWYSSNDSSGASKFIFNKNNDSIVYSNTNLKSTDRGKNWIKIDSLYNSWTDLGIDDKKKPTLYGVSYNYGLFQYTDILTTVYDESYKEERKSIKNFPNPFNSTTEIQIEIPQQSIITIIIYNSLGQRVRTILNSTELKQGEHSFHWNGNDENGIPIATGIYLCGFFVEHSTKTELQTLKLLLLK